MIGRGPFRNDKNEKNNKNDKNSLKERLQSLVRAGKDGHKNKDVKNTDSESQQGGFAVTDQDIDREKGKENQKAGNEKVSAGDDQVGGIGEVHGLIDNLLLLINNYCEYTFLSRKF
jgi:hypothetical protein